MRKRYKLVLAALAVSLLFAGCGKDNQADNTENGGIQAGEDGYEEDFPYAEPYEMTNEDYKQDDINCAQLFVLSMNNDYLADAFLCHGGMENGMLLELRMGAFISEDAFTFSEVNEDYVFEDSKTGASYHVPELKLVTLSAFEYFVGFGQIWDLTYYEMLTEDSIPAVSLYMHIHSEGDSFVKDVYAAPSGLSLEEVISGSEEDGFYLLYGGVDGETCSSAYVAAETE